MATKNKKSKSKSRARSRRKMSKEDLFMPLAKIKVIGVGGAGGNAVSRMSHDFVRGVELIAINTDHQDLDYCEAKKKIYIGKNLTRGLGAGMNPELGRQAAEENRSEIAQAIEGADLVFISSGFGGGTGSGAAPIVAEVAKQAGALTLAVITKPFAFEGAQRARIAEEALANMKDKVDALIVVPNDRIFSVIGKDTPIKKAFEAIDEILRNALQGIVELIMTPGIINVDFADIRSVVQDAGMALVGMGIASGQDRAVNAVNAGLHSPLLEFSAEGAHGVVLGISGGADLKMTEINDAAKLVAQTVDPGAKIIFGAYQDRKLKPNQIKVTVVATGFSQSGVGSSTLFGASPFASARNFLEDRPGIRSVLGDEKEEKKETKDGDKSGRYSPSVSPSIFGKNKAEEAEEDGEDQSSPWDIPTFLRKKKK